VSQTSEIHWQILVRKSIARNATHPQSEKLIQIQSYSNLLNILFKKFGRKIDFHKKIADGLTCLLPLWRLVTWIQVFH